ncbi:hypothetical protein CPter91_4558 [Collimonas pratensis]|uniref:Uncharacterized protein n=1 Tax=Collimonas pratensis TaxID=279113 RepID=A0A127QA19_9BURK|nr:hypothetical protein CPter91_4558 [Collimonas pratensis]
MAIMLKIDDELKSRVQHLAGLRLRPAAQPDAHRAQRP